MLVLSRKPGQSFLIGLDEGVGDVLASALFARGPIKVLVAEIGGRYVRLGVEADPRLVILRDELVRPGRFG